MNVTLEPPRMSYQGFDPRNFPASGAPLRVVLLNGPPGAGKDTAGIALRACLGAKPLKLAETVKAGTHALFGIDMPSDAFEDTKDTANPLFDGLSPRQAYIMFSEQMVKPNLGDDHFGKILVRRMRAACPYGGLVAVTDSGFAREAQTVIDEVGRDNVMLIRLHAIRRGCTFEGDSRSHLVLPGIKTVDIRNDGRQVVFEQEIVQIVRIWSHIQ